MLVRCLKKQGAPFSGTTKSSLSQTQMIMKLLEIADEEKGAQKKRLDKKNRKLRDWRLSSVKH